MALMEEKLRKNKRLVLGSRPDFRYSRSRLYISFMYSNLHMLTPKVVLLTIYVNVDVRQREGRM